MNFNQAKLNDLYSEIVNRQGILNNGLNLNHDTSSDIGEVEEELKVLSILSSNVLKTIQYYKKQNEPKKEQEKKSKK